MALEPITRQEKIIAGQDLTPITRMEKFLKEFGGSGGGAQPDWNAAEGEPGHILNRPFYESTEVLFDQRVEFSFLEGMMGNEIAFPEPLEPGKPYRVTYNGVAYDCIANILEDGRYLGNGSFAGLDDTGEPFFIMVVEGGIGVYGSIVSINSDTSATVKIEKSVIHTIDPKFLPGGGGGDSRFVVNVTRDAEYKPSFDKTYEEIMAACLAGKEVVLRDAPFVFTLSDFDPDEGYCAFIKFGNQIDNELVFSIIRITLDGYWYESGWTVNCTMNWTDTNEPSQSTV